MGALFSKPDPPKLPPPAPPPPPLPEPTPVPTRQTAKESAPKRSGLARRARGGRASTILTELGSEVPQSAIGRKTLLGGS